MNAPTQPRTRSGPDTRPVDRRGVPARSAPPRRPVRPRRLGSAFLLPPWTRAPLLAFRSPAVLLAVFGATLILACASSSPALFLSSASSEALRRIAVADCPDATYPSVHAPPEEFVGEITAADDRRMRAALAGAGLAAPYLVAQSDGIARVVRGTLDADAAVFFRPGALDNVTVLQRGPAKGLWLPETAAQRFGVRPGARLALGDGRFTVAGIYRDLWRDPTRPYWCSYTSVYSTAAADSAPPPLLLATDLGTYNAAQRAGQFGTLAGWVSPIDTSSLTLTDARSVVDRRAAAYQTLGWTPPPPDTSAAGSRGPDQLPAFAERARLIRGGLRGPVVPIALGGTLLALLLVGAAGSYWADRRAAEIRLLSARGVGPGALAGKAVLELALPAVAGTALGWLLARWLTGVLGPSPHLDRAAPGQAALTAAGALTAGIGLLALVAGLRARAATERPVGARRSALAAVPWELALLAAAAGCYLKLRSGDAVVVVRGIAQINLLVVAFPLLFLVGGGVLAARLLTVALPAVLGRAGRRSPAWYLASRRVAAARLLAVTLLAAAATPIATMAYAAGLTQTAQYTLDAKARLYVGATVEAETLQPLRRTTQTDAVGTLVTRYLYGKVGGGQGATTYGGVGVQLLAVDPDTFADTAFWDRRFADLPLPALLDLLRRPVADGRVPAVLVPDSELAGAAGDRIDLPLGTTSAKLTVAATARLFPGRRQDAPMLIVSAQRLGAVDPHAGSRTELWSRQDNPVAAQAAITAQNARLFDESDLTSVFNVANFVGISWTFGYLTALAALVGLVAVGGLLLYLETRQRARAASYALGRRMGLTRASHLRSLLAELSTLLALAYAVGLALAAAAVLVVYRRLDVDPARSPAPLLTTPTTAIAGTAAAVLLVILLASLYAQRAADRTNVAEVLRLGS